MDKWGWLLEDDQGWALWAGRGCIGWKPPALIVAFPTPTELLAATSYYYYEVMHCTILCTVTLMHKRGTCVSVQLTTSLQWIDVILWCTESVSSVDSRLHCWLNYRSGQAGQASTKAFEASNHFGLGCPSSTVQPIQRLMHLACLNYWKLLLKLKIQGDFFNWSRPEKFSVWNWSHPTAKK